MRRIISRGDCWRQTHVPNLIMKNKVDRSTLEQIKYPNGITRPQFNFNKNKKPGNFKPNYKAQASNDP